MLIATRAGGQASPNEDYAALAAKPDLTCAVLLDGAGGPSELPTGCQHGTPWYVRSLGDAVLAQMYADPTTPLTQILATGIDRVAHSHATTCDLSDIGTPSSTIVMTRAFDGEIEYLVLGDSTFVAETEEDLIVLSDHRIDDVAVEERRLMEALPTGTPEHQAARIEFVTLQRKLRNRSDGYWIASTAPEAASHAITGMCPATGTHRLALLSDGTTRFVEFGLGSWEDLLNLLGSAGPDVLFDAIRSAEAGDPQGERWPRAKRCDDVAVVYMAHGLEGDP